MRRNHVSNWIGQCALTVTLLCVIAASAMAASANEGSDAVVFAVRKRVCFESYWWNRDMFRLGKTISLSIRRDGNIAYVWTEELSLVPGVSRWANFFTVFLNETRAIVGSSYGYNLDVMHGTPDLENIKSKVFSKGMDVETARLALPSDCTPQLAMADRERQKMLKVINASIAAELTAMNKSGGAHYPEVLQIVVAKFNADYPATMVFVPSTGDLFHVALQDSENPLGNVFLKQGKYPIRQENNKNTIQALKGKIRRFGIKQDIKMERGL